MAHRLSLAVIHVDDLKCTGNSIKLYNQLNKSLNQRYGLKGFEPLSSFVGISYKRESDGSLVAHMKPKLEGIFEMLPDKGESFRKSRVISTPSDGQSRDQRRDLQPGDLTPNEQFLLSNYSSIVGSVGWPAKMTNPHLAQSYSMLSRNLANPQPADARHLRRVLQYIFHHLDDIFIMRANPKYRDLESMFMLSFSDSNYGDQKDKEYRSTTGYCIFLCGVLVSWKAKRQDTTACSTFEAEMDAAYTTFKESLWLKNLLVELGFMNSKLPIAFWCDNNSAILNLGKPPEDWTRVHLNTKYFRCCQWCLEKTFLHEHIEGRLNPADIFTKGLPADVFSNLRNVLIQSLLLSFLATFRNHF